MEIKKSTNHSQEFMAKCKQ